MNIPLKVHTIVIYHFVWVLNIIWHYNNNKFRFKFNNEKTSKNWKYSKKNKIKTEFDWIRSRRFWKYILKVCEKLIMEYLPMFEYIQNIQSEIDSNVFFKLVWTIWTTVFFSFFLFTVGVGLYFILYDDHLFFWCPFILYDNHIGWTIKF